MMHFMVKFLQQTGFTQKRLAEILGFSTPIFNMYLLNKREPGAEAFHVINQAEMLLDQALENASSDPLPPPGPKEIKAIEKEIRLSKDKIALLDGMQKDHSKKINQAQLALAWLKLWAQNPLHPQKPWSANYLDSEMVHSMVALRTHHQLKVLEFDLKQANERLEFLENMQNAEGNSNA